jgi:hemolysin III
VSFVPTLPGGACAGPANEAVPGMGQRWRDLDMVILGATLAAALGGAAALAALALQRQLGTGAGAALIYAATLVASTLASFLYHAFHQSPQRAWLRRLDHAAIFLLIAGTYTPVGLVGLADGNGKPLVIAVWTLALLGACLKLVVGRRWDAIFVLVYVLIGWLALFDVVGLVRALAPGILALLAAGGLAFSFGALIHWRAAGAWATPCWHSLVLAGCAVHYGAILSIL